MTATPACLTRLISCACLGVILLGYGADSLAQARIIQPGAPGESVRELSAEDAIKIANTSVV